jgi:probable HAF family extracellular repeat protein
MKSPTGLFVILASLLCASSLPAWADPGYRLVPMTDAAGPTDIYATDINRRGEVVGSKSVAGGRLRAFRWRAGEFTDLQDIIDPTSAFTQAVGINDRSTIVGADYVNALEVFQGVLIQGAQVTPLTVVPGETQVFPLDVNNRGQFIADSDGGAHNGSYFVDGDNAQWLDSMNAIALNERGVVAGNVWGATGSRAALWQDGAIMDLGVVPGATSSFVYALNDRQQVVGIVMIGGGSQAMRWQDGEMALLPRLFQDQAASSAESINNWGVMVGSTVTLQPQYGSTATLWLGNHVVDLDSLVRADDPLKPFVHLADAGHINDRGDIVVSGFDSRTPDVRTTYFMTLFDN